jgi:hypothetical protein
MLDDIPPRSGVIVGPSVQFADAEICIHLARDSLRVCGKLLILSHFYVT